MKTNLITKWALTLGLVLLAEILGSYLFVELQDVLAEEYTTMYIYKQSTLYAHTVCMLLGIVVWTYNPKKLKTTKKKDDKKLQTLFTQSEVEKILEAWGKEVVKNFNSYRANLNNAKDQNMAWKHLIRSWFKPASFESHSMKV